MKNVGMADPAFFNSFQRFYPDLYLINKLEDVEKSDLIIFPGGGDVNPAMYGEPNTHSGGVSFRRDEMEKQIFEAALRLNKRIFGSCRGHQIINVCLGGKLIQDIYHPGSHTILWVEVNHTLLPNFVNSLHHQGYFPNQAAPGVLVLATEPTTGLVEVASYGENILTTQFHPEWMEKTDKFFAWLLEAESLSEGVKYVPIQT